MYKLEKCIDGEWYLEGNYETLTSIGECCLILGKSGVKQVRVEEAPSQQEEKPKQIKESPPVPDLYKPDGWGTGLKEYELPSLKNSDPGRSENRAKIISDECHNHSYEEFKSDTEVYEYQHKQPPRVYERKYNK